MTSKKHSRNAPSGLPKPFPNDLKIEEKSNDTEKTNEKKTKKRLLEPKKKTCLSKEREAR